MKTIFGQFYVNAMPQLCWFQLVLLENGKKVPNQCNILYKFLNDVKI